MGDWGLCECELGGGERDVGFVFVPFGSLG